MYHVCALQMLDLAFSCFHLDDNISTEGASQLASLIRKAPSLQEFKIGGNELCINFFLSLTHTQQNASYFLIFDLGNPLGDIEIKAIINCFPPTLTNLSISGVCRENVGAEYRMQIGEAGERVEREMHKFSLLIPALLREPSISQSVVV